MTLHDTVRKNRLDRFRELLAAGADVNAKDRSGERPLALAIWLERAEMVSALLEAGADVNARDRDRRTPLLAAASDGNLKLVRVLLAAGADLNARNRYGDNALKEAVENGHSGVARHLLRAGAEVNVTGMGGGTALASAVTWGNVKIAELLLGNGADPNAGVKGTPSPLIQAVMMGQPRLAEVLLAAGADPNYQDGTGRSALLAAIAGSGAIEETERLALVRRLLQAGADPDPAYQFDDGSIFDDLYPSGTTALMLAAAEGQLEIVDALIAGGATVNARNARGHTALDFAAKKGEAVVVERLRAVGAEGDFDPSRYLAAALARAAGEGDAARLQEALAAGAEPDSPDPEQGVSGRTPLFLAAGGGHEAVVRLLLEAGADPRAAERALPFATDGRSVLHEAARGGSAAVVRLLLEAGAPPDALDKWGATPLLLAAEGGHTGAVEALVEAGADTAHTGGEERTTPLLAAIAGDHETTVFRLVGAGAPLEGAALVAAARRGLTQVIRTALAAGVPVDVLSSTRPDGGRSVDPDEREESGEETLTPLSAAARFQTRIVERDPEVDVLNVEDNGRWLAAAEERQLDTIRLLLEAGAAVDARDGHGRTALLALSERETYVEVRCEPDRGARHIHGEIDPRPAVRLLLAAGADVNARDRAGDTPLLRAVRDRFAPDKESLVDLLLAAGADVNARNQAGETPLLLAADCGAAGAVRRLLAAGAEVNTVDGRRRTPLLCALDQHQPLELVRMLVNAGAAVNVRGEEGETPLARAAGSGDSELVELLRAAGAVDPDARDRALWEAASAGRLRQTRKLLAAGADPEAVFYGRSVLLAAAAAGHEPTVRLLLDAGVPADEALDGGSPLVAAIGAGHAGIARLLLERGADPNARGSQGRSALLSAAQWGDRELVALLLGAGAVEDVPAKDFLAILRFAEAAESSLFNEAVAEFERSSGARGERLAEGRARGAVYFRILAEEESKELVRSGPVALRSMAEWSASAVKVSELVERHRQTFLERGCFLFDMGRGGPCAEGRLIGLLPTTDPYTAIAAMGTGCNDGERGPAEVIAWFRALEQEHPFVLAGCGHDFVDVRFTEPIPDPRALARRLYDFCHDMVDQGTETLGALAEQLRASGRAHFWWD